MDIVTLFILLLPLGVILLMSRSAKKKQQQAMQMRDRMEPGTGVRTIGGMYATVKEVRHDTVLLEVAPGVHAVYAKNAVGAVLEADEYSRIVDGDSGSSEGAESDAASPQASGSEGPQLRKTADSSADSPAGKAGSEDAERRGDTGSE